MDDIPISKWTKGINNLWCEVGMTHGGSRKLVPDWKTVCGSDGPGLVSNILEMHGALEIICIQSPCCNS